jgi:hypothetical protein
MRRHLGWPGVFVLILASISFAQDGQKDKKADDDTPDYYPLQAGNQWQYKITARNDSYKVTMRVGKVEDDGKLVRIDNVSTKPQQSEHLMLTDKGLFRARVNGAELTPAIQLIPYPVKLGSKWNGTYVAKGSDAKNEYKGEIGPKEETVEVPAGKFQAIRVRISLQKDGQQVDATYWFARDVGMVKQTSEAAGSSLVLELEKFERKKN